MASWLWGGSGPGESVDTILLRFHSARQDDDIDEYLQELCKASKGSGSHEAIGKSIPLLVDTLKNRRNELDVQRAIVEILENVMKVEPESGESYKQLLNTTVLVEVPERVGIILDTLSITDYMVRYGAMQILLRIMQNGKTSELQTIVMNEAGGTNKIMDLLEDNLEPVRNQALLLIYELVQGNLEIQKIVAFEGAFERLLTIIDAEDGNNGNIIVVDCLKVMRALLRVNISNQNYFRETSCIPRLCSLLDISGIDTFLLADSKVAIIEQALTVVSCLSTGTNPSISLNKATIRTSGILEKVANLALQRVHSDVVRTQALITLGDIINNDQSNGDFFGNLRITIEGQTYAGLQRLLTVMLKSTVFKERTAAVRVFQCYLHDNEEGQLALATTLMPSMVEEQPGSTQTAANESPIAQELLKAALNVRDPLKSWMGASVLSAICYDNIDCKERIVSIPLEIQTKPVTLMTKLKQFVLNINLDDVHPLAVVSLLRLFATWLRECHVAISAFLQADGSQDPVPFLVDILNRHGVNIHVQGMCAVLLAICYVYAADDDSARRSAVRSIIAHRIGIDKFTNILDRLRKSAGFLFAEQDLPLSEIAARAKATSGSGMTPATQRRGAGGVVGEEEKMREFILYNYLFVVDVKDVHDKLVRELKHHKRAQRTPMTPQTPAGSTSGESTPILGVNTDSTREQLVKTLQNQVVELRRYVSELEEKAGTQSTVATGPLTVDGHHDRVRELEQQLEVEREEKTSLAKLVKIMENSDGADVHTLNSMRTQILALEEENKRLLTQSKAISQQRSAPPDHLLRELSRLRKENEDLKLQASTGSAAPASDSLLTEFRDAELQLAECHTKCRSLESRLSSTKEEFRAQQDTTELLQKEISHLRADNEGLEKRLLEATSASSRPSSEFLQQMNALREENQELKERVHASAASDTVLARMKELEDKLAEANTIIQAQEAEQEQLLVALAESEVSNTLMNTMEEATPKS